MQVRPGGGACGRRSGVPAQDRREGRGALSPTKEPVQTGRRLSEDPTWGHLKPKCQDGCPDRACPWRSGGTFLPFRSPASSPANGVLQGAQDKEVRAQMSGNDLLWNKVLIHSSYLYGQFIAAFGGVGHARARTAPAPQGSPAGPLASCVTFRDPPPLGALIPWLHTEMTSPSKTASHVVARIKRRAFRDSLVMI